MTEEGARIIRRAREGSPDAVNALFERYGERLHGLIRIRLGGNLRRRLDSRDILQATLMKAFQGLERFEGTGSTSVMAWLGRIAHDEICDQADYYGRKKRDLARDTTLADSAKQVAVQVRSEVSRIFIKEETERLEAAFDTLSEAHREIILLRDYEDLTFPEMGERLDKSPDACRMLYARAMAALTMALHRRR